MIRGKLLGTGLAAVAMIATTAAWTPGANYGIHVGSPDVKTLGQMAFGPGNVLFIGDNDGAQILAVEVNDAAKAAGAVNVDGLDGKIAKMLGVPVADVRINDMAVHPASKNVYVTVTRGSGASATSVLLKVTRDAARPIAEVPLTSVKFSTASISNAPADDPNARRNARSSTITDIEYADGAVWVAGLSNEEFASSFRRFSFPFDAKMQTTTVEIYHVSHKASETRSPVTSFTVRHINGAPYIVAGYTCTPIVAFSIADLKPGQHVVGRTVAELGAGNTPTDIVSFTRDGKDVIMVVNNRRPLMLISAVDVAGGKALTVPDVEGIARTTLDQPSGITQMSDLDATHVVVIQKGANGLDLKSIAKSSL
ncbi:MAG: hypothetical protein O2973_00660 [Gemmatimonadetes bacterium]|nr:hypothetical protein [Gemmatimonadota bacterium]